MLPLLFLVTTSDKIKTCDRKAATYVSYIRPTVKYAFTAWEPHTQKNVNKQEHCDYTSSVTPMLHNLHWPSLEH